MEKTKVLITGSNGIIGKVLWQGLIDAYDLYGLDVQGAQGDRTFQSDISNLEAVLEVVERVRPACIIHLAGNAKKEAGWESILKNNIIGTRNVYEAAKAHTVKRVIFASSNQVTSGYEKDLSTRRLISISDPIRPDSYYATGKVFGEALARQFYELYQLESICLRFGLVLQSDLPEPGRQETVWLSHRDLVQVVRKSLEAPTRFGIYYAISDNQNSRWDLSATRQDLGYRPKDGSAKTGRANWDAS
jgi:nucleoside-diphosphate-sugar epimerase